MGETVLKFTYLYDDFPLKNIFFFFYGLTEFIYVIFSSGLKVWVLLVQHTFRLPPVISAVVSIYLITSTTVSQIPVLMLRPEFGTRIAPSVHDDLFQNWPFPSQLPLTEEGGHLRSWDSSQSFGFYLLPSPVWRFVRAIICPCTPFFTHPVTKYKHLLVFILTWICYLRNWPRFLFQQSVLGLLIQTRRNSSNPPLLLSQWETTWHYEPVHPLRSELNSNQLIGPMGREFANDPGDRGSISDRVIPKTLKMVIDTSSLNTQQYKVRIEGKVEQSRERSSALPYTSVL